jgi:hypothetical protein
MRTQTSKLAEAKFDKYGSMSLVIGPNKVLFKRHVIKPLKELYEAHRETCNMAFCGLIGLAFGIVIGIWA